MRIQLSLLNHQVGAHLDLKDVDFSCVDLINRLGPLSPSALARHAGLHPATMTGILDRLQRAGWITRERDPNASDRRAVTIRGLRDRNAELFKLYSGMNVSMDEVCARYTDAELDLLADFLRRTTDAGQNATDELAGQKTAASSPASSWPSARRRRKAKQFGWPVGALNLHVASSNISTTLL